MLLPGTELLPPHLDFPLVFPAPVLSGAAHGGREPRRSGSLPVPLGRALPLPTQQQRSCPRTQPRQPQREGLLSASLGSAEPPLPVPFPAQCWGGAGRLRSCSLSRSGIFLENWFSLALWQHPQRTQQNCSTVEDAELTPAAVSPCAGRGVRGLISCPLWAVAVAGGQ